MDLPGVMNGSLYSRSEAAATNKMAFAAFFFLPPTEQHISVGHCGYVEKPYSDNVSLD